MELYSWVMNWREEHQLTRAELLMLLTEQVQVSLGQAVCSERKEKDNGEDCGD
jgi:hypothetical protein